MPISSTESGKVIAMLVLGFRPVQLGGGKTAAEIKSGVWVNGRLTSAALSESEQRAVGALVKVRSRPRTSHREALRWRLVARLPPLLQATKPGSLYPPAYEVALYPLTDAIARLHQIRLQVIVAGVLLLIGGLGASPHHLTPALPAGGKTGGDLGAEPRATRAR
jgi:hypothetical protein